MLGRSYAPRPAESAEFGYERAEIGPRPGARPDREGTSGEICRQMNGGSDHRGHKNARAGEIEYLDAVGQRDEARVPKSRVGDENNCVCICGYGG